MVQTPSTSNRWQRFADGHDHVTLLQAGALGGAAGRYGHHEGAGVGAEPEQAVDGSVDVGGLQAEEGVGWRAAGLELLDGGQGRGDPLTQQGNDDVALRLLTWNMNYWQQRRDHDAAWAYLDDLDWDVALLQEAVVPVTWTGHAVFRSDGISATRPGGSAIVSRPPLEPLDTVTTRYSTTPAPVDHSHPGAVAAAVIHPPKGEPITVVSVYGLIEYGYAVTTLHRILSDLTPLLDTSIGRRLGIAGDLNCSTQLAPPHRARHKTVFDRFVSLGLVNVTERRLDDAALDGCPCADEPCRHVRTHFHSRSQKAVAGRLRLRVGVARYDARCEVLDRTAAGRPLSDHAPVMVSITS